MADKTQSPSDAVIAKLYAEETGFHLEDSPAALLDFARAIETEVRKQDTELIRQMLDALEQSDAGLFEEDDDPTRPVQAAITAARARLNTQEGT